MVVKKQKHIYRPPKQRICFVLPSNFLSSSVTTYVTLFSCLVPLLLLAVVLITQLTHFSPLQSLFSKTLSLYKQPPSVPTKSHRISSVHPSVCVYPAHHPPVRSANYYSPYRYNVPVANRNRIAYKRLRGALLGYNSLDPPLELWPAANWGNHPFVPLPLLSRAHQ